MVNYLGVHFKINGYQLTRLDTAYVMVGMILLLSIVIVISSVEVGKRKVQIEG